MLLFRVWRERCPWFRYEDVLAIGTYFAVSFSSYPMFTPVCACWVIVAVANEYGPIAKRIRRGPVFYIGQISLSLYVVHAPILNAIRHLAPLLAIRIGIDYANLFTAGLTAVVSVAAASVLNRAIEYPGIRVGNRLIAAMVAKSGHTPRVVLP